MRYHWCMVSKVDKTLAQMRELRSISYADLHKVCVHHFGEPRQNGTSHAVFRTPWAGDPASTSNPLKAKPSPTRSNKS